MNKQKDILIVLNIIITLFYAVACLAATYYNKTAAIWLTSAIALIHCWVIYALLDKTGEKND